ncbi:hypothetical protein SGGMMB4_04586 [Sodalis glossinidius str. 'morsitans']|uniref:Uncharacterized protein n=1 Tax=Sodalis glossinidius (strain morsitans) TaxID=343509 RepID=A0A193QM46_SODGM|nr:hypothetical protein [Sodalis glossinidius]CRL46178.1 hypothetical protein SGGMMB4_04586 [Sodalis glossinidius str. 'morsitans']
MPVQAGKQDGTRIIPGDGEKENLIYIDANATYDFTFQWALMNDDAPAILLPQWGSALLTVPLVII